jgi:hypothetical protein
MRTGTSALKGTVAVTKNDGAELSCETAAVMLSGAKPVAAFAQLNSILVTTSNLPAKGEYTSAPVKVNVVSPAA